MQPSTVQAMRAHGAGDASLGLCLWTMAMSAPCRRQVGNGDCDRKRCQQNFADHAFLPSVMRIGNGARRSMAAARAMAARQWRGFTPLRQLSYDTKKWGGWNENQNENL